MGIIYIIKNDINKKVYIGKTITTLNNRWSHHKESFLREDWHLYRAMRKYGIEHFWIEKIAEYPNEQLNFYEQYWINKFDSYNNGYNMTIGGEGRTALDRDTVINLWKQGYSVLQIANIINCNWTSSIINILKQNDLYDSDEIKRRKNLDIANKQSINKVIQYNEKAEIVSIFNSVKEASEKTGINKKNIRTALDTHAGAGGFFWRFEGEEKPKPRPIKTKKVRKVKQINLETNEIIAIYKNASEAARQTGATNSIISAVCRGERNKHHGFKWQYVEEE